MLLSSRKRNQPGSTPLLTTALRTEPGTTLVIGVETPLSERFTSVACRSFQDDEMGAEDSRFLPALPRPPAASHARESLQCRQAETTDMTRRKPRLKVRTRGVASTTRIPRATSSRISSLNWTSLPRQRVKPAKRGGKRLNRF